MSEWVSWKTEDLFNTAEYAKSFYRTINMKQRNVKVKSIIGTMDAFHLII